MSLFIFYFYNVHTNYHSKMIRSDQMKYSLQFVFILASIVFLSLYPEKTYAIEFNKLSKVENSKQWEVVIGKPDSHDKMANKSKPGYFNVYSMDIKNVGEKDVNIVRVEAYRDQPNSTTEYELFTADGLNQDSFHHMNFPLYSKSNKLNVIVIWTKASDTNAHKRKYREQFVFNK
jgi:hypothetical protein